MQVDQLDSEFNRFVLYHDKFPTLQAQASYSLSRAICCNHFAPVAVTGEPTRKKRKLSNQRVVNSLFASNFIERADELITSLAIPKLVEERLKKSLRKVHDEIQYCVDFFTVNLMSTALSSYRIPQFDANSCIWLANGEIDLHRTAVQLLGSGKLSKVQKFAVWCAFCMEDELNAFSVFSLPRNFLSKVNLNDDWLLYYWICCLKDDLEKIQSEEFDSVNATMAELCSRKEPWIAFEYFWSRLNSEEQLSVVRVAWRDRPLCEQVFAKVSLTQQRLLLPELSDEIISALAAYCETSVHLVLWARTYFKDFITVSQLVEMVIDALSEKIDGEVTMRLLIKIWQTASVELKNQAVEILIAQNVMAYFFPSFVDEYCLGNFTFSFDYEAEFDTEDDEPKSRYWNVNCSKPTPCQTAYEFLSVFLAHTDVGYRRKFMMKNVSKFGADVEDPRRFARVINAYLPNIKDENNFKKKVAKSLHMRKACEHFLGDMNLDGLKIKLQFYMPPKKARAFLKELILSAKKFREVFLYEPAEWQRGSKFIDEMYSDDSSSALEIKKLFISSFIDNPNFNAYNLQQLYDLIETVRTANLNNKRVQMFQRAVLRHFVIEYSEREDQSFDRQWQEFDPDYFFKCVVTCLNDDQDKVRDFKTEVLPIDALFDGFLRGLADVICEQFVFDENMLRNMDELLKCYLEDDERSKEYKLNRINDGGSSDFFERVKNKNTEEARSSVEKILQWFFDGDQQAIDKFKLKDPIFA